MFCKNDEWTPEMSNLAPLLLGIQERPGHTALISYFSNELLQYNKSAVSAKHLEPK